MGLRDLIAAKAARTATLPLHIGDGASGAGGEVALILLRALEPDLWDSILDSAPEDGDGIDLAAVRPALLAESCVDEDLRDAEWWAEQLARPVFSKGDLLAINQTLLALNLNTPEGRLGNV